MTRICSLVFLLASATVALEAAVQLDAQIRELFTGGAITDGDPGTVVAHNLSTGERRVVYRPERGWVFDFKPSPTRQLIAIQHQIREFDVTPSNATTILPGGRTVREIMTLRIVAADSGAQIEAIPRVRSFAWSPDGEALAYTTGDYRGPDAPYGNTEAWILTLGDRTPTLIHKGRSIVTWSKADNHVYLWGQPDGLGGMALRYNLSARRIELTTHRSVYFSATGEYYYAPSGMGPQEDVFETATDAGLKAGSRVLSTLYGWRPLAWAPDADLLLMEASHADGGPTALIYDPKHDTIVDLRNFDVHEWGSTADSLIIRAREGYRIVTVSELISARAP